MKRLLLIAAACFCLSACVSHLADLTLASNQNVSLNNVNLNNLPQVRNVSGSDYGIDILFIPLKQASLMKAVRNALNKSDSDVMIDTSVERLYLWLLIGYEKISVNGTAVKTRGDGK